MEIIIAGIDPREESFGYIIGMISPGQFVVFSPIEKTTMLDFGLNNIIDIDLSIIGPTDALNKTKNKSVNICIHAVRIDGDDIRKRFSSQFP